MAEQIVALADGAAHLAPATTLRQLAALLAEADLLVAADTGPLHLGGAVGVPVLGLYGASDPHRNGPYGANRALSIGLPCSPCWRRRDCPFDLRCMRELTPARVHEAARQLMRHARGVAS
jgi:ADP-heptose:LPS heptosyltransferase